MGFRLHPASGSVGNGGPFRVWGGGVKWQIFMPLYAFVEYTDTQFLLYLWTGEALLSSQRRCDP